MTLTYDNALLILVAGLIGLASGGALVWRLTHGASSVLTDAATLRQDHEWFRVTLDAISDAVLAMNADNQVTFLNAAAESLIGWKLKEARGKPVTEVFKTVDEKTRQTVEIPADRALPEAGVLKLGNVLLIDRNGGETLIDYGAAPVRDETGRMVGIVLAFRKVSRTQPPPVPQEGSP